MTAPIGGAGRPPHILHLDMDAFFAAVEQRDKPSLRGKPVIVGGVGGRGVVSTASYEAREFGVRSAMSMAQARRRAPHAAVLAGRFKAYHQSSRVVMNLLRELSPLVEAMSIDEAYVDLAAGGVDCSSLEVLEALVTRVRQDLQTRTEGLQASVGVGSSKLIAKMGSEAAKPNGHLVVPSGGELELISPLPVRAVPGIGPATVERLAVLNIKTVADLQAASLRELEHELGENIGQGLYRLAYAQDDRPVQVEREAKSISVEDTFAEDLTSRADVEKQLERDAAVVAASLGKAGVFARTISIKVRLADFSALTRSRTLEGATDRGERLFAVAKQLLAGVDVARGIRLVGLGTSNFTAAAQEELFSDDDTPVTEEVEEVHEDRSLSRYSQDLGSESPNPGNISTVSDAVDVHPPARHHREGWLPGDDVWHEALGRGWVWGSGHGRVTVRFESRNTGVGPVRNLRADDPDLTHTDPLPMAWDTPQDL